MTTRWPTLVDDLRTEGDEVIETHVSWVLLRAGDVLKLKKPVRFPFLDFSTPALRRAACEAESTLNRRLARDVYLGVVPITRGSNGVHREGGTGEPVEWAVHMRRLPDHERCDVRLARGALDVGDVERIAERVVAFHDRADADAADGPGSASVLVAHAEDNLRDVDARLERVLGEDGAYALRRAHEEDLARVTPLLDARRAEGRVRDGHGDLRLDHVYLCGDGEIRILDCIEFDRAFRVADVAADVAFFAMSLREADRDDLAESFVARVARDSGDHGLYALLRTFETYFALVRAKVTLARAAQGTETEAEAAGLEARGDALLRLASRLATFPAPPPVLVGIGGPIGSGKSTLAAKIGAMLGAPVLESDRLRKRLEGVAPTERLGGGRAFDGPYADGATERLYDALEQRAAIVLESGRSCVVDASYRDARRRSSLEAVAQSRGAICLFLACEAPREVLEARLRTRERSASVSDARVALLDEFLARYEPPRASDVRVDTSRSPAETWAGLEPRIRELRPREPSREGRRKARRA